MASGKRGRTSAHLKRQRRVEKALREQRAKDTFYKEQRKRLAPFVPRIKKIAKKKKLTNAEKRMVKHYTRKIAKGGGIENLKPVPVSKRKAFKKQLVAPDINAIAIRHAAPGAKPTYIGDNIVIRKNGRTWVFWKLDKATVRSKKRMISAAQQAFNEAFPIEVLIELAKRAFETFDVVGIHLWGPSGPVGPNLETPERFASWVEEKWQAGRYIRLASEGGSSDVGAWVNGIAILLEKTERNKRKLKRKKLEPKPQPKKPAKKGKVSTEMG